MYLLGRTKSGKDTSDPEPQEERGSVSIDEDLGKGEFKRVPSISNIFSQTWSESMKLVSGEMNFKKQLVSLINAWFLSKCDLLEF